MDFNEKVLMNRANIKQALADYGAHTSQVEVLNDVSDKFVDRLAKDNVLSKANLRNLFRLSPVWNEELDCLIINGSRTHNPDYGHLRNLADEILYDARWNKDYENGYKIDCAVRLFTCPHEDHTASIAALQELAPKAYVPGKKLSRVFRSLCESLGVADKEAGSKFQRLYAQFADELSAKKIDFKLFVSLNPAHFLTMSNPKCDDRGNTLTSCHSFNSTEYDYNNGCSGYARDNYTFIAFTVADPNIAETLNNRKTMRQIFAYKPGNGVLLQSRLYNTSGGTYGAQEDSKLYRDLIQREISALEDAPNLWLTVDYNDNKYCEIRPGIGFGGYADWTYSDFESKISIRYDHANDFKPFDVGTYGLCIQCGYEISRKLYCYDCREYSDDEYETCDDCEEDCRDTYPVHNNEGTVIYVCHNCRDRYYTLCEDCEEYYPKDEMTTLEDGSKVCPSCIETHYRTCEECDRLTKKEDLQDGLCPECRDKLEDEEAWVA